MAVRYRFSGHSDDLVHVERIEFRPPYEEQKEIEVEEYNVPAITSGKYQICTFLVEGDWGDCKVHAIYDGTWSFAISLFEEDDELPTGVSQAGPYIAHGYSTHIAFDCADNTRVILDD